MAWFLPGCQIVGLDIGAHSVKAVQLTTSLTDFKITGFLVREHHISTWKDLSEELRSLVQEAEMQGDVVVTSFPSHRVLFRTTEMPFGQLNKIGSTIRFEAESMMAVSLDGMIVDFALLESRPQGSTVLVTCVLRDLLQDYMDALREADIVPDIVDIDSLALARLMEEVKYEGTIALLDMGAEKASVDIFHEGGLRFARSVPIEGGGRIGLKKIRPVLDEVILSIKAYEVAGGEQIDEIWLTGGRSRIKGVADYLKKEMRTPVHSPDFAGRFPASITLPKEANLLGGVALGLALRGLIRDKGGVNLAKKIPTASQTFPSELRKRALYMAAAAFFLVVLFGVNFFVGVWAKERQYTMLKGEMRRVFQETFPDVRAEAEGNELQLARERVRGMGERGVMIRSLSGGSPLETLREIAQRLPQRTKIVELDMDDERISLRGIAPSFAVVDEVRDAFATSELFQEVKMGNVELARRGERGVIFQMVLAREVP
jgi:Tfp pilus assembly PilM family ATPase/Tfp pilus assembly protein PilN